ncbi:MAG: FtsX-like permease family protein [Oscillospiraceae bacterium]
MAVVNGMVRCGMEIFKLIRANIKHKKGSFKSIAALMAIIVLSFTGTVSNNDNVDRTLREAQQWAGTPGMTAIIPLPNTDEELFAAINGEPDIAGVKTADCIMSSGEKLDGQEIYQSVIIYPESFNVYRVLNESRTSYIDSPEPLCEGEIYIPYSFTGIYKADIGSEVSVEIPTAADPQVKQTYNFRVKGLIADPSFGAAVIGTKRFFISEADFAAITDGASEWSACIEADIDLRGGADYIRVKKALDDSCGIVGRSFLVISDNETASYTKIYAETGSGIVVAFVILLVTIIIITMWHSITTSVEMEYVNLGVLKSQGFTTGKIRLVYIVQYVLAEVIGAVVGLILSVPVLYLLGSLFQPITGLLTVNRVSFLKCGLLSVGVIAVCIIFIILATARIGKISPVRAISGGRSEVHFDSRTNVPIKAKPLSLFMGLRQFTSRWKSCTGVVLIAALLVYFMMTITVLSDRLSGENIIEGMVSPDIVAIPSDKFELSDMAEFEETVRENDENAKVLFNSASHIMADGIEFYCEAPSPADFLYKPLDGRMPIYGNEIAVTEIVSDELGKKIGDTVVLGSGDNAGEYIITGYYQSLSDLGRTFSLSPEGMLELTGNRPSCYIELSDAALAEKVSAALDERHGELIGTKIIQEERSSAADGMLEMIDGICVILVAVVFSISIIFAAVVINMVCSKSFVRERTDIGVLKALGFSAGELRVQFAFRFMIIAAIGSVIGGAASFFFTAPLLGVLMKIVGLTRVEANITPLTFVLPAAAICASFFLFSYIAARQIKRVEVRELISE